MLTPVQILALLREAIESAPPMDASTAPDEKLMRWFAKTAALIDQADPVIAFNFRQAQKSKGLLAFSRRDILQSLHDAYYKIELEIPAEQSGAFIPAGDAWNGYAALVRVIQSNCDKILIIDPYIVSSIFMELIPHATAKHSVRLLTAKHRERHPALLASLQKWQETHTTTPNFIEARYADSTDLHDRLIIVDDKEVWLISQSIKDIAKKSAASVTKSESQIAEWKVKHYEALWKKSTPIR